MNFLDTDDSIRDICREPDPPIVRGGQGRSDEEVTQDGAIVTLCIVIGLVCLILVMLG